MQSALSAWRARRRRRAPGPAILLEELRAAAASDRTHAPSPALARWMEEHGERGGAIHPDAATEWMRL
eukprot:8335448-Lingulodinium_polyedra.AAC.1